MTLPPRTAGSRQNPFLYSVGFTPAFAKRFIDVTADNQRLAGTGESGNPPELQLGLNALGFAVAANRVVHHFGVRLRSEAVGASTPTTHNRAGIPFQDYTEPKKNRLKCALGEHQEVCRVIGDRACP